MFSIITPTYNRAGLVQATIKSVLAQTYPFWQLVVVDDGSTDNTEEALQPYLTDRRIVYLKKENSGQADSLNFGAAHATEEFIVFLDSDDEAYKDWLAVAHDHIDERTGIACAGAIRRTGDGRLTPEGLSEYSFFGEKMKLKFTCGSLFIRRKVFSAVGGYDARLRSNIQTDLGYRLVDWLRKSSFRIVTVDAYLVQINVHAGPRVRTNWSRMREGGIQFLQKHYQFIRRHHPKEIANICSTIAFASYKLHRRRQSLHYLLKAIRHNPLRWKNYVRLVKYGLG